MDINTNIIKYLINELDLQITQATVSTLNDAEIKRAKTTLNNIKKEFNITYTSELPITTKGNYKVIGFKNEDKTINKNNYKRF